MSIQGKPVNIKIVNETESEIKISWEWSPKFDLPNRFVIFNRVRDDNPKSNLVGVFDTFSDFNFTIKNLTKSTNYEIGIGADYIGVDYNAGIVLQTTTSFIFASTLPRVNSQPPKSIKKTQTLFLTNVFQKTLRRQAQIMIGWNQDDKSDYYHVRYFEKNIVNPKDAIQVRFKTSKSFKTIGGKFIPNGLYTLIMQGCNTGVFGLYTAECSEWSNQIDVNMPPLIKNLKSFLGKDSNRGLRAILKEFNKNSILELLRS